VNIFCEPQHARATIHLRKHIQIITHVFISIIKFNNIVTFLALLLLGFVPQPNLRATLLHSKKNQDYSLRNNKYDTHSTAAMSHTRHTSWSHQKGYRPLFGD